MKRCPIALVLFALAFLQAAPSLAVLPEDLISQASPCKTPQVQRPKLPVNYEHDGPVEITADFNGDGWCDFALGVPYPINSKMSSYYLNELMALGGPNGWRPPFHGRMPFLPPIQSLDREIWPRDRVDMTLAKFVYVKDGSAPYILGIRTGYDAPKKIVIHAPWCEQYAVVHRWDDGIDGLKKVDDATRDVILNFYYSRIEKSCTQLAKERAGQPASK